MICFRRAKWGHTFVLIYGPWRLLNPVYTKYRTHTRSTVQDEPPEPPAPRPGCGAHDSGAAEPRERVGRRRHHAPYTAPHPPSCVHPEPAPPSRSPHACWPGRVWPPHTPSCRSRPGALSNLPLTSQSVCVSLSRAASTTVSRPRPAPARGARGPASEISHYIKYTVI